jgi:hypothetical protein
MEVHASFFRLLGLGLSLSVLLLATSKPILAQDLKNLKTSGSLAAAKSSSSTNSTNSTNSTKSIVLARPINDTVPNFLNELDSYLMSDELVNHIEDQYALRLRDFSLKQGFLFHTRDSKSQKNFLGSNEEEKALHIEIANSIKHYMLVRGIPKYLSSRSSTRFIGETYQQTITLAQKATRIEFSGANENWKFGSGINPFNTKAWAKFSNKKSTIELSNFFNQAESLTLLALTQYGYYQPRTSYYIQRNALEVGLRYATSLQWELDYRTYYPLKTGAAKNIASYISMGYRF